MNSSGLNKGFVLWCDDSANVLEVIRKGKLNIGVGENLNNYVHEDSRYKFDNLLKKVKSEKMQYGWEINFRTEGQIKQLFLTGIYRDNQTCLIALNDLSDTANYVEEMLQLNNEQNNHIRDLLKQNNQYDLLNNSYQDALNELTEINNELTNVQRELAKKNLELNQTVDALKDKNEDLDKFSYVVSHDLKAPVRGIHNMVQMIREDYDEMMPDGLKKMVEIIRNQTDIMNNLIMNILSFSRAGMDKEPFAEFGITEVLNEVLEPYFREAEITSTISEDVNGVIYGSRVQLHQVLSNLISNAIKYHDKEKKLIQIKVGSKDEKLLNFEVSDNGPGIPEAFQQTIFAPFDTGNRKSSSHTTGIGLSIVKKIVELNGGQVGLRSDGINGSTFSFTWPRRRGDGA